MNTRLIVDPEIGDLLELRNNPPHVSEKDIFQKEIKALYYRIRASLSEFGDEGDHYGISDFAIRPDLRDRSTFSPPPAPEIREFVITILSSRFFKVPFVECIYRFLIDFAPSYRVLVFQDFDPQWYFLLHLTLKDALLSCTNECVSTRIQQICRNL